VPPSHRRFALLDVTFAGVALPSATMDIWTADTGIDHWSARALLPPGSAVESGRLSGKLKDGRIVSGNVTVANRQAGPAGPRGQTLVELHGSGALEGIDDEIPKG
jgi:hypothetical protein